MNDFITLNSEYNVSQKTYTSTLYVSSFLINKWAFWARLIETEHGLHVKNMLHTLFCLFIVLLLDDICCRSTQNPQSKRSHFTSEICWHHFTRRVVFVFEGETQSVKHYCTHPPIHTRSHARTLADAKSTPAYFSDLHFLGLIVQLLDL